MQTALTSDLVRDSKLDASVNGDVTRHVIEVAGRTARQRKVRQEQLWERVENLGEGAYGTVWLEKLVSGECSVSERAVKIMKKQVQKSKTIDYSRELEAIAKFSHPKVSNFTRPHAREELQQPHYTNIDANSTTLVLSNLLAGLNLTATFT